MKCEDVRGILEQARDDSNALERRFAQEHLLHCEDCRAVVHAVHVLQAEALAIVPGPRHGAFERAMLAAVRAPAPIMRGRNGFWIGLGVGSALAASLAAALILALPRLDPAPATATPLVSLMPNEARDIRIALESPEPLARAGIRVVLTGAIGLSGFGEQRELRWFADLDRGANQLTLPVVALGPGGGQLLVEVEYAERRRTFLIDVRADGTIADDEV